MECTVLGNISIQEEESPLKTFIGRQVELKEFADILHELEGQSVSIELLLKTSTIMAAHYQEIEWSYTDKNLIIEESDMSQAPTVIPVNEIKEILVGEGWLYDEHYLIRLENGLEYFIYVSF